MKVQFSKVFITALFITSAFAVHAQQSSSNNSNRQPQNLAGAPMMPPPPPNGNGPMPPPRPHGGRPGAPDLMQEAIKLTTLNGTVSRAIANDHFEYNGFVLKTAAGEVLINYPSHLGEQIFNKAKSGTNVKVSGFYRANREGTNEFHLVMIDINGDVITDGPPAPPAFPVAQQQKTLTSSIKELRYTTNKEVNGFVLNSGEVVGIPPHIAYQLGTQLKAGEKISVTGFLEPKRQGVVYSQNIVQVKAQTLTINGQAYLVR